MGTQAKHLPRFATIPVLLLAMFWAQVADGISADDSKVIVLKNVPLEMPGFGLFVYHTQSGARVAQVLIGSPADRAGIEPGDLLKSGNDTPLADLPQDRLLAFLAANDPMTFVITKPDGRELQRPIAKQKPRDYVASGEAITARAIDLQLSGIRVGEAPPDFTAISATGESVKLSALHGKPVVVVFWATWCLPCFAELQTLKPLYEKLHPRGLEIIGVSLDENRAKFEAFLKQNNVPWPQHFDGKGWSNQVAQEWTVVRLSATVLIDRDGKVVRAVREDISRDELHAAIEQLCP